MTPTYPSAVQYTAVPQRSEVSHLKQVSHSDSVVSYSDSVVSHSTLVFNSDSEVSHLKPVSLAPGFPLLLGGAFPPHGLSS